ncbi:MAG: glycoside hydrolase family 2, partial [Clostridiales bacterium]|nr:glycoside hydrolase family 2 [Clostridiales bacterium]
WEEGLMGCWYTPISGIWQTVWLESAGNNSILTARITPDIDAARAHVRLRLEKRPKAGTRIGYELSFEGKLLSKGEATAIDQTPFLSLDMRFGSKVDTLVLWYPQRPALYDLKLSLLEDDGAQDEVKTYFGMRKVEVQNGQVLLNNSPLYQRLVLDQGYWPDTLLTPPSDEAIKADVQWIKDFGYNGVRKHQKIEDPRFYYWCDKMGLLVWGEVPSAYEYGPEMVSNISNLLLDFIERDYNHPSIIAWVPLNESWGVREIYSNTQQQAASRALTQLCRAVDPTRLVSANDGWEQTETDICALHDYAASGEAIALHFASREQEEKTSCDHRMCYAKGDQYTGEEAFLITEYGGIAMSSKGAQDDMGGMQTWGYHDKVENEEEFFQRFASVTDAIRDLPYCQGYCYTQLTDVMQEINGLLSPERKPKVDPDRFRKLNQNPKGR